MMATEKFFGLGSHLTQEAIGLYVDALKLGRAGELPDQLLTHVADCEGCKTEIADLYSLVEGREYTTGEAHPYLDKSGEKKRARQWKVYRIAALLALGVGLGFMAYYFMVMSGDQGRGDQAQGQREAGVRSDSAALREKNQEEVGQPGKDQYAANLIESPNLEDLVKSEFRSGTIEVASPLNGAVVGRRITFDWSDDIKGPFIVKILTNREKVVASRPSSKPHVELEMPLDPGLYYWKVESAGELLHVGKFFVK